MISFIHSEYNCETFVVVVLFRKDNDGVCCDDDGDAMSISLSILLLILSLSLSLSLLLLWWCVVYNQNFVHTLLNDDNIDDSSDGVGVGVDDGDGITMPVALVTLSMLLVLV